MKFVLIERGMTGDDLGFVPGFLSEEDRAPAAEQIGRNYLHGGGWRPQEGFKMEAGGVLTYPGDPPMRPRAMAMLREELIIFYPHDYVAVVQPDGTFEVARVD